jgi:hypothetical protein
VIFELYIIIARAISGKAFEDHWNTFENEVMVIAILEISFYIIGSITAVTAYWYTYLYFKKISSKQPSNSF